MKENKKQLSEIYPRLSDLFFAYLGQDYREDYGTYETALNAYIRDTDVEDALDTIKDVDAILKDTTIKDLDYSIGAYLYCCYDYERYGLTVEQFLLKLKEDLKSEFSKKYKLSLVKTNNATQKLKR